MKSDIINNILKAKSENTKRLAILIDPDKADPVQLEQLCKKANEMNASFFFVGGSLLSDGDLDETVGILKQHSDIPAIIFPGSSSQISAKADGILFLSLLSSRNPEMLIGQQVVAAPYIQKTNLEVISTAYLIIESGAQTTASYMSNSNPIPSNKSEIAACTALAGEYLGMKLIYLDGGSGAKNAIPAPLIQKVREYTSQPIIVGGGINTIEKAKSAFDAGADVIVIGNAFEKDPDFIEEMSKFMSTLN